MIQEESDFRGKENLLTVAIDLRCGDVGKETERGRTRGDQLSGHVERTSYTVC